MSVLQSDFSPYASKYYEGQVIDSGMSDIITKVAEEDIEFGKPVVLGSKDDLCKTPTGASTDVFLGISCSVGTRNIDNNKSGYKAGDVISIVRAGRVAVKVVGDAPNGGTSSYKITAAIGDLPKEVHFQGTPVSGSIEINGSTYTESGLSGQVIPVQLIGANLMSSSGAGGAVDSVNGQTGAVVLDASDVGAVPDTRTVNGNALDSDITLDASDVGATPEAVPSPTKETDAANKKYVDDAVSAVDAPTKAEFDALVARVTALESAP